MSGTMSSNDRDAFEGGDTGDLTALMAGEESYRDLRASLAVICSDSFETTADDWQSLDNARKLFRACSYSADVSALATWPAQTNVE